MAKQTLDIAIGSDIGLFIVSRFLYQKAKVLFIGNNNFAGIAQLQRQLNLVITIMHDEPEALEMAKQYGFNILFGSINTDTLSSFEKNYFDFVVAENVLQSAKFPGDTLIEFATIAKNTILSIKNQAHWKNRLKFLFSGSFYVNNQFEIVPDNKNAWFNKDPWLLSHKDVVNICNNKDLFIESGIIIYKNNKIDNIHNIRAYPNMNADKVYYLIKRSQ